MPIRVLLVEDEAELADFVVRGLTEESYVVGLATDGEAGLALFRSKPWDLVLLDWWVPRLDGLSLLARMRQLDSVTPVLFLTARDAISDRVQALNSGADDYLCKPFAFEELLARVRALTRRRDRQGSGTLLRGSGVTIDLAGQRVWRGEREVDLTAKELALLILFMRNPGIVLTRTYIFDQVWGERYDGSSNALEVHVMDLRKKLETHGSRLIFTVRGRGYRFGDPAEGMGH